MHSFPRRSLLFVPALLFSGVVPALAQKAPMSPRWGTTSENVLNVNAADFDVTDSSFAYTFSTPGFDKYMTSGVDSSPAAGFHAGLHLPTGAIVNGLDLQACDETATGALSLSLVHQTITAGIESTVLLGIAIVSTGTVATPGCGVFSTTFPNPPTIDNTSGGYFLFLRPTGVSDGSVRFAAVRVRYVLQVSPAPATASFLDVPTSSPQFRFVEALVAAGITAGCGNGNYCPDQPLTRGQMAVFLSVALGLHWPN